MRLIPRNQPRSNALTWGLITLAVMTTLAASPTSAPAADPAGQVQDPDSGHGYNPNVVAASPDAARAMTLFKVPSGLKISLWAAEPLLANPVAFAFDETGRAYVVETFRLHHGVTDNRGHMNWLDDDLASRTVEDRVAMYRKHLGKEAETYGVEHDRLRRVEDRDGDGKADQAEVFADGFHDIADGLAAGVLARKDDVYFTCIPNLWLLKDTNGDGKADVKKSLSHGYGVHVSLLGHDLHGLIFGPDGKLYFSVGDRGLNVKSEGKSLVQPDSGSVLRCDPDGTNLEFFATGLRNPQELAFDELGNLFTVDNNSDSGDKARVVYLIEGSESGWQLGYQYIEGRGSRGPWNAEKLWFPAFEGQAASIVPPVANLSDGPSGLAYNPGATLLPDRYRHHFFLADFRGGSGNSGVRAFSVKPEGAGFALDDSEQFLWGVLSTDVAFGPDGALYVSDWVEGWNLTGKGRIYRLADPKASADAIKIAGQVKTLLAEGFDRRSTKELIGLLAHADQRVRQEAQFALAARGQEAVAALDEVARKSGPTLARLHAVWGLGQISRKETRNSGPQKRIEALLEDSDPEVRGQAAKVLGDLRFSPASRPMSRLLDDASPRVRSLAAIALGKLGDLKAIEPLKVALRANADQDPFLRHALVMGLSGLGNVAALVKSADDPSRAVRLGALLALRRLRRDEVTRFLDDDEPAIVTEAARAIYDLPIESALPRLARLVDRTVLSEPTLRRVVSAIARVGGAENAQALAHLIRRSDAPESIRVEAIDALAGWHEPPVRDRVLGLWRPSTPHPAAEAAVALNAILPGLLVGESDVVPLAALRAVGPLRLDTAGPLLEGIVSDTSRPTRLRVEALRGLARLEDPRLDEAVTLTVKDPNPTLRIEGQRLLAKLNPSKAIPVLSSVLDQGTVSEKQGAFATLGGMPPGAADDLLVAWLDRLEAGKVPAEVELDLLDAARRRDSSEVAERVRAIDAARPKDDPLAAFRESLVGGDARRGRTILTEKSEVSCLRCHKVRGQGGEVGPDLTGIGARQDRRYLLESIVMPNRQIAKGFETLVVATSDGQIHSGIVKDDSETSLRLITAEGKSETIAKSDIEDQKRGASAMPDDLIKHLSKSEVRDLVEYLSSLK